MTKKDKWLFIYIAFALIIAICLFTLSVYDYVNATVVIPSDDNNHYYVYNHISFDTFEESDFLTVQNYNDYYDALSGNDKTQITNYFLDNTNNKSDKVIRSFMLGTYQVDNNYLCPSDLYFTPITYNNEVVPIEDCIKFIGWNYSANQFFCVLYYSPGGDQIVNSTNYSISASTFKMTYTYYSVSDKTIDNEVYLQFSNPRSLSQDSVYDSTNNFYYKSYGVNYPYFYYDDVCLFDSSFISEISNYINAYNAYLNSSPVSIDRRTDEFINRINPQNTDEIIQDGFDPLLFNGTLGFNWFSSNGSVNYVSSLDQFKPFVQLKYKINNYTDIHKDDVSIVWDSSINMKLTYADSDGNSKFITSCKYDASGTWDLVGHENQFTLLASQESNLYTLRNVRSTGGSNFYGGEFKDYQNINQNISYGISAYRHDNDVVTNTEEEAYNFVKRYFDNNNKGHDTLDSYGFIYFNVYLKNSTTGETSKIYSSVFDLFNNKFQDNSSDLVNNDDSAYNDFVNSFNYLDQNGDLSLVDYAKPYNNNNTASGGQAIITITNPQFPYLLVDIPEGDWMSKTPNLTNILGDFKNALEEVHDESILPVMAQTYNYLPAEMWRYIVYGVELLLMVGIWRAITRR